MGRNTMIRSQHLRKHWHRNVWTPQNNRVRCHFDQAAAKKRRYLARQEKAKAIAPRPVAGYLRPAVRCPTFKYNTRTRLGRGFTTAELKEAGIGVRYARTVGIAVDTRRKDKSEERKAENVQRLKAYKARLVVLSGKKASTEPVSQFQGLILPLVKPQVVTVTRAITEDEKKLKVFETMRKMRSNAHLIGRRKRWKELKAAEVDLAAGAKTKDKKEEAAGGDE
jgi:large subunit ribosomal protein L13e